MGFRSATTPEGSDLVHTERRTLYAKVAIPRFGNLGRRTITERLVCPKFPRRTELTDEDTGDSVYGIYSMIYTI